MEKDEAKERMVVEDEKEEGYRKKDDWEIAI